MSRSLFSFSYRSPFIATFLSFEHPKFNLNPAPSPAGWRTQVATRGRRMCSPVKVLLLLLWASQVIASLWNGEVLDFFRFSSSLGVCANYVMLSTRRHGATLERHFERCGTNEHIVGLWNVRWQVSSATAPSHSGIFSMRAPKIILDSKSTRQESFIKQSLSSCLKTLSSKFKIFILTHRLLFKLFCFVSNDSRFNQQVRIDQPVESNKNQHQNLYFFFRVFLFEELYLIRKSIIITGGRWKNWLKCSTLIGYH